jgi:ABC-2 type transport system permease protein
MNSLITLLRYRWRAAVHLRDVLREQSLFKVGFILLFALGLLAGLWALFLHGFTFLDKLGGVGLIVIPRLFALFFLGLSMMLVLSSLLSTYTTLYRSEEMPFLMLKPVSMTDILVFKHLESAFYSSWAFFFIIIPFVGAYAWYDRMPWYFSIYTFIFAVPFVGFCAGVGTLITLLFVRWIPRRTRPLVITAVLAALAWAGISMATHIRVQADDSMLMLSRLVPGLKLASHPLLPSWWMSEGILALSRGHWFRGIMFWNVLLANWLLVALLVDAVGRRVFFEGWQRVMASGHVIRRKPVLLARFEQGLRFLSVDLRCLIMKDLRIFLRDPQQWMQVLIFFGLLGLYFFNLRTLHYHQLSPEWKNLIGFLNVFSTSAVLCSLGSRFIYPQMSLEGQAFWIIGMAPTAMKRVLKAKFLAACTAMLAVSLGLILISVRMLALPVLTQIMACIIAVAVAIAIAGLSTGLGAIFLDLRQRNPAAIVSSFGGTLNLVMSLGFMLCAILPFGALFHFYSMDRISLGTLHKGVAVGLVVLACLTWIATVIPLYLGRRSLETREY